VNAAPPLLDVAGLTVRFGGLAAVENVSLSVGDAGITGLIGPNGAGKTTTFNACSGFIRGSAGTITFAGEDITTASPAARARRGIGRTFQRMELFESLSVRDNVALGREASLVGSSPLKQIIAGRTERQQALGAAEHALELCGIGDLAEKRPPELSTGQRRLVELARVTAGSFRLLLLDEPSSGLDKAETQSFGRVLQRLASDGTKILVVEHDMSLVLSICDYIFVLDFGQLIFQGSAAEVADSHIVRAAYLGSEDADLTDAKASAVGA
jgi:ABC-type branched-subunit amino acid transport system ATPase component